MGKYISFFFNDYFEKIGPLMFKHFVYCFIELGSFSDFLSYNAESFG